MKRNIAVIAVGFVIAYLALPAGVARAQRVAATTEWRYFGGDKAFTRYAPHDQINRGNVGTLRVAWRQPASDPAWKSAFPDLRVSGNFRSTPIIVNSVLYAPNALGFIRAMDPTTGATLWEQRPFAASIEEMSGQSPRGVDYWKSASAKRSGCSSRAASTCIRSM